MKKLEKSVQSSLGLEKQVKVSSVVTLLNIPITLHVLINARVYIDSTVTVFEGRKITRADVAPTITPAMIIAAIQEDEDMYDDIINCVNIETEGYPQIHEYLEKNGIKKIKVLGVI